MEASMRGGGNGRRERESPVGWNRKRDVIRKPRPRVRKERERRGHLGVKCACASVQGVKSPFWAWSLLSSKTTSIHSLTCEIEKPIRLAEAS